MNATQIADIIRRKNEQREQQVGYDAEAIVEKILEHQEVIASCNKTIKELQDALKALTVEAIDPDAIIKL
jgi:hypothetical protein